tara:strand:+ start:11714 stop:12469 length:756 start_codon:yes stop_codon:yes gene_type:complete
MTISQVFIISLVVLGSSTSVSGRVFTDLNGRQIEAEIAGVRGDNVLLTLNGKMAEWPISGLSEDDQIYIEKWARNPPPVKLTAQVWERDGAGKQTLGGISKFPSSSGSPNRGKTVTKSTFKHYQIDVSNPTVFDAENVTVQYAIYVVTADGDVEAQSGRFLAKVIEGRKRQSFTTKTAELNSTRRDYVSGRTDYVDADTGIVVQSVVHRDIDRTKETLGGIWVKVFNGGKMVAESRKLTSELARELPRWPH